MELLLEQSLAVVCAMSISSYGMTLYVRRARRARDPCAKCNQCKAEEEQQEQEGEVEEGSKGESRPRQRKVSDHHRGYAVDKQMWKPTSQ